jgi:hypothetical protein
MPTDFAPTDLRCNYLVSPLAIRAGSPSFSWTSAARRSASRSFAAITLTQFQGAIRLAEGVADIDNRQSHGRPNGSAGRMLVLRARA